MTDFMLITAASKEFGPSLLALLGSLHLNWPNHPPIRVYDIGLDQGTLETLKKHQIEVVAVPPFCPHWRDHFTWKIWCLNDAPAQAVLWMDAGLCVLRPLDEILEAINCHGYFLVPNYQVLDREASEDACAGCGVAPDFRLGKLTLAGGLMGFRKDGETGELLAEALEVALVEKNIAATQPSHRHDQAIISLLMYKRFGNVIISDGIVYLGWQAPNRVAGQKIWVHRRTMHPEDLQHFAEHISKDGAPFIPSRPSYQDLNQHPLVLLTSRAVAKSRRMLTALSTKLRAPVKN
jgi:hypothetical protein